MLKTSIHSGWRRNSFTLAILLIGLLLLAACSPQRGAAPAADEAAATEPPAEAAAQEAAAEPTATPEAVEEAAEDAPVEDAADAGPDPVAEGTEAETVELQAADAESSTGRVIAEAGVNVRTGPGTDYPLVGVVSQGTEGEIVGVSEDGQWWVARVSTAPNEQGWVAAAYVEATNADNVPVIPAPSLPDAAADATSPAAEEGDAEGADADEAAADAVPAATPVSVPDQLASDSLILFSASRVLQEGNRSYDLEDIYAVPAQPGSTAELIIENAMQPALLRGGETLAFRSTQPDGLGLSAYDFGADERVRYSSHLEDSTPRWSPSGDRLVFSSDRTGDRLWRIYLVEPIPGDDTLGFPEAVDLGFGKDADWHPSQDLLVFKGCDDNGDNCGLWTINVDGSERSPLTDGFNDSLPRWSPNGESVVFMSDSRDGNWEIYVLSMADGAVTRLTDDPANDGLPAWSPDGSQIAFMSDRGGAWGIWVISAAGGEAQQITQLEEQLPDWLLQGIDWPR
jgi:hypothetical protein